MTDIPVIPRAPKSNAETHEAVVTVMRARDITEAEADAIDLDPLHTEAWDAASPYVEDYIEAIGQAGKISEAIFLSKICKTLADNGAAITEITNTAHEFLMLIPEAVDVFYDLYYQPNPNVRVLQLAGSAIAAINRVHTA